MVFARQNKNIVHSVPVRDHLKTLQCGPFSVWDDRSSQKMKKCHVLAPTMKLSYGFRIVTRMFLGHFGDVESIFDGFSVSKRQ